MPKRRAGAAFQQPRAIDKVRSRRQGGTAASGNVTGKGIQTLPGGQLKVEPGDGLEYDDKGRIRLREPAEPLVLLPGSPRRYALLLDDGFEVRRGRLRPMTSTSVQIVGGALVATPSLAEVTDPDNPGESAQQALARKANLGDARFSIARGVATLVAGTVTIANTDILAGAIIVATHQTFGGTPGLLSSSLNAGVDFTITSANVADTSTVCYAVWNP